MQPSSLAAVSLRPVADAALAWLGSRLPCLAHRCECRLVGEGALGHLRTGSMAASASLWSDAGEERADFARLRRCGRSAAAESVDMDVTTGGESGWAVLALRISGPDAPPFEGNFGANRKRS